MNKPKYPAFNPRAEVQVTRWNYKSVPIWERMNHLVGAGRGEGKAAWVEKQPDSWHIIDASTGDTVKIGFENADDAADWARWDGYRVVRSDSETLAIFQKHSGG